MRSVFAPLTSPPCPVLVWSLSLLCRAVIGIFGNAIDFRKFQNPADFWCSPPSRLSGGAGTPALPETRARAFLFPPFHFFQVEVAGAVCESARCRSGTPRARAQGSAPTPRPNCIIFSAGLSGGAGTPALPETGTLAFNTVKVIHCRRTFIDV